MLNLAGFGSTEHVLLSQGGFEGLREILAVDLDTFRARVARAARELNLETPVRPHPRGLVGPGAHARGRVASRTAVLSGGRDPAPGYHGAREPIVDRVPARPRGRRDLVGAGHRRGRDRALPEPAVGRLRAGSFGGGGPDRILGGRPANGHELDPRRSRGGAAGLRRRGSTACRCSAKPSGRTCATCVTSSRASTASPRRRFAILGIAFWRARRGSPSWTRGIAWRGVRLGALGASRRRGRRRGRRGGRVRRGLRGLPPALLRRRAATSSIPGPIGSSSCSRSSSGPRPRSRSAR